MDGRLVIVCALFFQLVFSTHSTVVVGVKDPVTGAWQCPIFNRIWQSNTGQPSSSVTYVEYVYSGSGTTATLNGRAKNDGDWTGDKVSNDFDFVVGTLVSNSNSMEYSPQAGYVWSAWGLNTTLWTLNTSLIIIPHISDQVDCANFCCDPTKVFFYS